MLWERHAKMESMTFVAIVFTILKDMDNDNAESLCVL